METWLEKDSSLNSSCLRLCQLPAIWYRPLSRPSMLQAFRLIRPLTLMDSLKFSANTDVGWNRIGRIHRPIRSSLASSEKAGLSRSSTRSSRGEFLRASDVATASYVVVTSNSSLTVSTRSAAISLSFVRTFCRTSWCFDRVIMPEGWQLREEM